MLKLGFGVSVLGRYDTHHHSLVLTESTVSIESLTMYYNNNNNNVE